MYGGKIKLVNFSRDFLDKSWEWLNDEEIKRLTATPSFSRQEQEIFFSKLPIEGYCIWGVVYGDVKIGVAGIKGIKDGRGEYFGYIGDKKYWNKGLFASILSCIKDECELLGVNFIYLKVNQDNLMAISAYKKNGFIEQDDLCTKDKKYMFLLVGV